MLRNGNVSIPQSLTDALTALKLDALKTAMNAINAKIEAAGSAGGGESNGGQGGAGALRLQSLLRMKLMLYGKQ